MGLRPHYLMDLVLGVIATTTLALYWLWAAAITGRLRAWTRIGIGIAAAVVLLGVAMSPVRIAAHFPNALVQWCRCIAMFLAVWTIYALPIVLVLRSNGFKPGRRRTLVRAAQVVLAAPPVVAAAAFIQRDKLTFREVDILIPGLPPSLNGLKLVQLSDIHLSPFVSEALLERSIALANETKAHIALVTGDLISRQGDPLDTCLKHLRRLRSDAGTFGCHGNHEVYAGSEEYTTIEGARHGINFLRMQSQPLRFGDAELNLVGVDYQRRERGYLRGVEDLVLPGATNILLSHNPDVFPVAASQGFDLTLSGHTHGGQVNVEILDHRVNLARFYTPYVYGRYKLDGRSIFVTRGIGTVGAPARLGAPPEVALIRLCAS
jgi:predicted MPP superfamily phosphohydrolase